MTKTSCKEMTEGLCGQIRRRKLRETLMSALLRGICVRVGLELARLISRDASGNRF